MTPTRTSGQDSSVSAEAAEGLRRFLSEVPKPIRDGVHGVCRDHALILPAETFDDFEPDDAANAQDCYHWHEQRPN